MSHFYFVTGRRYGHGPAWGSLHELLFIAAIVCVVIMMLAIRDGRTDPFGLPIANMLGLAPFPLFYLAIRSGQLERR